MFIYTHRYIKIHKEKRTIRKNPKMFTKKVSINWSILEYLLRDIQKPPGCSPGKLVLGGPDGAGGLEKIAYGGPCQPLQFCDSAK